MWSELAQMKNISNARSGDWSALDAYLRDVSQMEQMTDEEASTLGAKACAGDVSAQERLVKSHLRLVVRIAHHYAGFGLPLADLISEGNIALIRAAELYNPKFGTKFTTYASVWVKQRIHRAITKQARAVRIPICGMGGIATGDDAVAFLLCGATAVQVGTASYARPDAAAAIRDGLSAYLARHGFASARELVGKLEAQAR